MKTNENITNAVNMSMEEFAEKVKQTPSYAIYRRAVTENKKIRRNFCSCPRCFTD